MDLPEIQVSLDGKHILIGTLPLTFEEAKSLANDILGKIEYTHIWGNRNDRRLDNE